eukprot:TRINITY_DN7783_c0_g5_i1.p1 TRINITY_DN7783_c0_g5~~TRINITY_DN7783_c0_g5_i1.p1  ORF type:complete len:118 (+),score=42.77 TRINITY_DN7783_c0_g5_i1:74-427(+)
MSENAELEVNQEEAEEKQEATENPEDTELKQDDQAEELPAAPEERSEESKSEQSEEQSLYEPLVQDRPSDNAMEIRAYLDRSVMPVLNQALIELTRTKPENPIEFVAHYLLNYESQS